VIYGVHPEVAVAAGAAVAPFGAARRLRELDGLGGTVTFLAEGREHARSSLS
jgi:hypothetical protein